MQTSKFVVLSADRLSVRPNFSMQRTVLILRNIPAETPPNEAPFLEHPQTAPFTHRLALRAIVYSVVIVLMQGLLGHSCTKQVCLQVTNVFSDCAVKPTKVRYAPQRSGTSRSTRL
jgi:hypothetical protein